MKLRGLTAPKEVRIKMPGLGFPRDLFRVSLETRDKDLIRARLAMFRDLFQHGHTDLLRGRQEGRVTTQRLHAAYKAGPEALAALKRELAGALLGPLAALWKAAYRGKDRERTFARADRFVAWLEGATGRPATTADLTAERVETYLAQLTNQQGRANRKHADTTKRAERPASNATKNRHRGTISSLATYLVKHQHLALHPIAHKRVEKFREPDARMPEPFTPDDYRGYLDTIAATPHTGAELGLFFLLLLHTGADAGEVMTREARHVELERTVPRVRFKRTKTHTPERAVPVPGTVVVALRGHLAQHRLRGEQRLFAMLTEADWRPAHERGRSAIGRPSLRVKDLRHLAAIAWAKAGIRIDRIADMLGHSRLEMTRCYVRFMPDSAEEADIAAGSLRHLAGLPGVTPISAAQRREA
jgi:integrase